MGTGGVSLFVSVSFPCNSSVLPPLLPLFTVELGLHPLTGPMSAFNEVYRHWGEDAASFATGPMVVEAAAAAAAAEAAATTVVATAATAAAVAAKEEHEEAAGAEEAPKKRNKRTRV